MQGFLKILYNISNPVIEPVSGLVQRLKDFLRNLVFCFVNFCLPFLASNLLGSCSCYKYPVFTYQCPEAGREITSFFEPVFKTQETSCNTPAGSSPLNLIDQNLPHLNHSLAGGGTSMVIDQLCQQERKENVF